MQHRKGSGMHSRQNSDLKRGENDVKMTGRRIIKSKSTLLTNVIRFRSNCTTLRVIHCTVYTCTRICTSRNICVRWRLKGIVLRVHGVRVICCRYVRIVRRTRCRRHTNSGLALFQLISRSCFFRWLSNSAYSCCLQFIDANFTDYEQFNRTRWSSKTKNYLRNGRIRVIIISGSSGWLRCELRSNVRWSGIGRLNFRSDRRDC